MRKKMRYGLIAGGAVLLLLAGGLFWFFYGTGDRVAARWMPQWGEEHVRSVRYGSVKAGGARTLCLENWEYGPLERPLLKAARAELAVRPPLGGRFGSLQFQCWKLHDVSLTWLRNGKQWTVNGRSIGAFLQELLQMPPDPQGGTVPLEASFRMLDAQRVTFLRGNCRLTSRPGSGNDGRLYTLEIDYVDGQRTGSLRMVIHPAAQTLECELNGMMELDLFRRLVAASGTPVKSLRLLHPQGNVQGKGKILLSFPELKVAQFQYEGEAAAGNFVLGAFSFDHRKPTHFRLQSSAAPGAETVLTIAETVLESPMQLEPKQLELRFRHDSPVIDFSCICDLAPALNAGLWGFGGEKLRMPWPLERQVKGSCNGATGAWRFTTLPRRPGRALLSVSQQQASLRADADHFELNGEGARWNGNVTVNTSFRNFRLVAGSETLESSGGAVQSRWMVNFARPGATGGVISGSVDFDLTDLSISGSRDHCISLARPMGSMDLSPADGEQTPAYHLMLRSNAISATGWPTVLEAGRGTYEVSINRHADAGGWNLPLLHGKFETFKIGSPRHDLTLGALEFFGTAALNRDWTFRDFQIHGSGKSVNGRLALLQLNGNGLEGKIDWRNGKEPKWRNAFSWQTLQTALGSWHGAFDKGTLTANGGGDPLLCEKPDQAELKAGRIFLNHTGSGRSLDLRNTDLQLAVDGNWIQNRLQAKAGFDKAVLVLGPHGRWESGRTSLLWQGGVNAGVADPGKCTFRAKQFGWRGALATLGAETMQGEFAAAFPDGRFAWKMLMDGKNLSLTGAKFSLLMPGGKWTAASLPDGSGAAGHVQFASGSGMLEWGKVMMDGVALDTDWRIGGEKTDLQTLPRGQFQIGKVLFSNGVGGSVKGSLAQAGSALDVNGELHSDLVSTVSQLRFSADWERQLQWSFSYDFPRTKLARQVDLESWFPQAAGVHFGGTVTMQGRFDGNAKGFRSAGSVTFEDTDWTFGKWAAMEGVSTKLQFSDLAGLVSGPGAVPMQFRHFRWHDWNLDNGTGTLVFLPGNQIGIGRLQAEFAGGRVQSREPIVFSTVQPSRLQEIGLPFTAEKISPMVMMPLLGMTRIESDFALSGTVNAILRRGQMRYGASRLEFHGENGFLGARHAEQFAVQTNDSVYRDFTLAVLQALRCTKAEFRFENLMRHGKELLQMKIAVDGRPDKPVPFVYQGSSAETPFRPAEKEERGFDGEVELSVELQLPCRNVDDRK